MSWKEKKRRIISVICIIAIVALVLILCGSRTRGKTDELMTLERIDPYPAYAGYIDYTVKSSDTLLDIAVRYCPMNADIYRYVRDVERLNERQSDTIYYGETIKIPVFETEAE